MLPVSASQTTALLSVLPVTIHSPAREIATTATPGVVRDLAAAGDHLYVADESGALRVLDVSNPSEPKVAGALEVEWGLGMVGPVELVVARGYLYLAMGRAGLWVVDVRSPQQPRLAGTYQPSAWVLGVAAKQIAGIDG